MSTQSVVDGFPVCVVGGPTARFEYGGLSFLTDPTLDGPGIYRPDAPGAPVLTKTAPCPATPADLGPIDVVLLSHDEHADNLDIAGRALLADVELILTTPGGGERLSQQLGGKVQGLSDWESVDLKRPDGGAITVTGVPAIHGPGVREVIEPVFGQVVGFVLTGQGLPTVYVSGDNASIDVVREIADRFPSIDTAIIFAGAPSFAQIFDNQTIVFDSATAVEAVRILGARRVIPAHYDSWAHFNEGRDELQAAFDAAGLADLLDWGASLTDAID